MVDKLIKKVVTGLGKIVDKRRKNTSYDLGDMLNLSFSMFHLKDSSLSSYKEQYSVREKNLLRVYEVKSLPGDTALRTAVDGVDSKDIQGQFKPLIEDLQSEGILSSRYVLGGYVAVAFDGTGFYCSGKINCPHCLTKKHRNGKVSYYHQALGAVAVSPKEKTVFPIAAEAIIQQDGNRKNDCEINASKRMIPQVRQNLGAKEKIIGLFDALYCNGPLIKTLQSEEMSYIIGTKGKTYVDIQVKALLKENKLKKITWRVGRIGKTQRYDVKYANRLILNGSHQNILVNYFDVKVTDEKTGEQIYYSTFITDIEIDENNIKELVSVARCRWKIENETFNTLKNQGYHLEHNYGHGKKNLATNFMLLTFLAFLVDQIAQQLDKDFQRAKQASKTLKGLWEKVRSVFYLLPTTSMSAIYRFITKKQQVKIPALE